jgi:hypothetical protein
MFKHDFVYSVYEDFIDVDKKIKNKINKIKVTKFNEHRNNFNFKNMNPVLEGILQDRLGSLFKQLKLKLNNCWVQHYKKNDYHSMHTHFCTQKDYSFVWFISGDKNSAPVRFFDIGYPLINTGKIISFKFRPGVLLIFPGFIPHEVPINKSNSRLIVSGNLNEF